MSIAKHLDRLYVAITTPFSDDGTIDYTSLKKHIDFLVQSKIDALFLGGTTGEFETLTFEEKRELISFTRSVFSGFLVCNVSSCSLRESLQFVEIAEKNGANAITALPPYYRANVGDEGVAEFFNTIAKSTHLPLILYNFTRHSQNEISPQLMRKISCSAIKDSDKNFDLIEASPLYLCGGDSIIAEAVRRGAGGVVSVQGNYQPTKIVELFTAAKSGSSESEELQKKVAETAAVFRKSKQIARIKRGISAIIPGYPTNVRIPLVQLDEIENEEVTMWCRESGYE